MLSDWGDTDNTGRMLDEIQCPQCKGGGSARRWEYQEKWHDLYKRQNHLSKHDFWCAAKELEREYHDVLKPCATCNGFGIIMRWNK